MKSLKTRMAAVLCAVLTVSSLAACGNTSSAASKDLVVARSLETTDMLPETAYSNGDIWSVEQVYETLTTNKADGSGVEPGLATKWEKAADGLSWTFTLRKGVKFHNGDTMTADDVKFSLDFARTARADKPWQFIFEKITSVDVVDDYTVKINLAQPWTPLPADMAMFAGAIMPKDFAGKSESEIRNNPIGTGPFKVSKWTKGDSIKFTKNTSYWQKGEPTLNSVTFKYVPDANTRAQMVQAGQAHIDEFPTAASVNTLKKSSTVSVKSTPSTSEIWINLNNKKKPFDDVHFRRALSYAVDKAAIVKSVYYGTAKSANTFISENLIGYSKSTKDLGYSLNKAKEELAQSATPTGASFTIQVQSGDPEKAQIAQILQAAWKKLGINVKLQTLDSTTIYSNRKSGDYEVAMFEMTNDITDPDEWMHYMISSTASVNSGYSNPTIDSLIESAAQDDDENSRADKYAQVQQIVVDEAPMIPLVYKPGLYVVNKKVSGFNVSTLGQYLLNNVKISD